MASTSVAPRGSAVAGLDGATESREDSSSSCGTGIARIQRVDERSVVTRAFATAPLLLFHPRNHGHAAWIYTATYGGGLVDGDAISLGIVVDRGAAAVLATQAATKVYRSPAGTSVQLRAAVGDDAVLVVIPDPVVCFAGANYRQEQHFTLSGSAGLVLADSLTAGRRAMGERWAFENYVSRLTIRRGDRLLMYDAVSLRASDGDLCERMRRFDALCVLVIAGLPLHEHAGRLLARVAEAGVARRCDLIVGASRLGDDGCIVRVAGVSVEAVAQAVREYLAFVPGILGDDPWTRKW